MLHRLTAGLMIAAGTLVLTAPAFADPYASAPADCRTIAHAKFQEWNQPVLLIDEHRTLGDGSVSHDELVVTLRTAFKEHLGVWKTAALDFDQRAAPSPERMLTNMRLVDCSKGDSEQIDGQQATAYSFTVGPDDRGVASRGTIWIADASGLPVKETMRDDAPPANPMVSTAMTASYSYNGDVKIPHAAELAEVRRLYENASLVRNYQSGTGGGNGGPMQ